MLCEVLQAYSNAAAEAGLNPCSNGRCSASRFSLSKIKIVSVLILVLMEDALRAGLVLLSWMREVVLILVLMEDALRDHLCGY